MSVHEPLVHLLGSWVMFASVSSGFSDLHLVPGYWQEGDDERQKVAGLNPVAGKGFFSGKISIKVYLAKPKIWIKQLDLA